MNEEDLDAFRKKSKHIKLDDASKNVSEHLSNLLIPLNDLYSEVYVKDRKNAIFMLGSAICVLLVDNADNIDETIIDLKKIYEDVYSHLCTIDGMVNK